MAASITQIENSEWEGWDGYVTNSGHASCYHLSGWKRVVDTCFGHKTYYLSHREKSGKISGILPLVQLKSFVFGNFIVSMPYFNYGGICADSETVAQELFQLASEIARKEAVSHVEFRHTRPLSDAIPVSTRKVSMRLELSSSSEHLWNKLPSKLRSQIKRPIKEGMEIKFGKADELDSFYQVFSNNMRDLGTPVYSKKFFKTILDEFPEKTWIGTVYAKTGNPVASGFLIGFKETLEIPWASSLRSYNRYGPNMLLYWRVIEFAATQGYRVFDFGRSTAGEGTFKFKEQWGARPMQLYWHYWLKDGRPLPQLNPQNPKYRVAINLWRKLPVFFTKIIGPRIVKFLP